jgi:hypothetical protein
MRRSKKSELRVFKLRSGEEIIAKVAGKSKDKIKLQRPMRIVENYQTDPFTGAKRQFVFFTNWLGNTAELSADIPLDFIVVELSPDPDMISLYSRQTEIEDTNNTPAPKNPKSLFPNMSEADIQKMSDEIDEKLEEMLKQLASEDAQGLSGSDITPTGMDWDASKPPVNPLPFTPPLPFTNSETNIPPRLPSSIVFSVSIPQDILAAWVESGFLDYLKDSVQDFISTDFMEEIMNDDEDEVPQKPKKKRNRREKISKDEWKEPTDDLKQKPNYGNSHEDWSPYLKDYLPEQEPPKNEDEG